jgi:hypothetical protein
VGHQYRTIRAVGAALIIAVAVVVAGMAGMSSALAADDPAAIELTGRVVDGSGAPLPAIDLLVSEELPPDGGAAAFPVTTGSDGTFRVELHPWGTTDAPARLSVATLPESSLDRVVANCSQTWSVLVDARHDVAWAEGGPAEPLVLVAETTLLGEVCGTVGSPPDRPASPGNGATAGGAKLTPPPTDPLPLATAAAGDERLGGALLIGFVLGLAAMLALVSPRPGARRGD